jgi:iron complex transport system ATP-binding protein
MVLTQQTDLLLLDEPTTFLDVSHQIEVLDLLTDLNRTRGTTIVMVLHDLNMAARYADHLVALASGRVHGVGSPADVLTVETVRTVFGLECQVIDDPTSGKPLMLPIGRHHMTTRNPELVGRRMRDHAYEEGCRSARADRPHRRNGWDPTWSG